MVELAVYRVHAKVDSMATSALCSVALLMRLDGSEAIWYDGSDYCRFMEMSRSR